MNNLTIITPATAEPVSYAELRDYAAITNTDDRDKLISLGIAARQMIETYCRVTTQPTTFELQLDQWCDVVTLPARPATAVASVKYLDGSGVEQTLSTTDWSFAEKQPYSFVFIRSFPTIIDRPNAIKIRFTAGYTTCPQPLKLATCTLAARFYDHPEAISEGAFSEMPFSFRTILHQYSTPEAR